MKFNLRGLLQDEEFLVAAGLLQQGSQGKGIGEAFFPAIAQAGQAKKLFQSTAKKTKSVLNLVTGMQQFATETDIANSKGMLVPIPKNEKTTLEKVFNTETNKNEFATINEIINSDGQLVPIEKKDKTQLKSVTNTETGKNEFATIDEIINSDGQLVPIEKKDKTQLKEVENLDTGNIEFATIDEIIANDNLVPVEKKPLVKIEGDKTESSFDKGLGELDVKFVGEVRKDSKTASEQNSQLDVLKELSQELETGQFGTTLLDLAKIGQRFGFDTNWLSQYDKGEGIDKTIANAEVLQVISSQFVLDAIGKTKGSISDKEMAFFQSIAPNLSMSPDGIKNVITITQRLNDRKIEKAELLNEWIADGSIPSRKKNVDGKMMTFNQMWSEYVNEKTDGKLNNPLFSQDEKDSMFNLSKSANTDEGVKIRIHNGEKYYELPDGTFIYLGKV